MEHLPNTTLCLLVKENAICLGVKKRKLGKGRYNGYGGKVEQGEAIEQAALRELNEETGGVNAVVYHKVAEMTYIFPKHEHDQRVHVYLVTKWEGKPEETDEMTAEWFSYSQIPYDKMWDNDKYWMPLVLDGKKVKGTVHLTEAQTINKDIQVVTEF